MRKIHVKMRIIWSSFLFFKILVSVYSRGEYVVYPNDGKESCSSCPTLQTYINNASLFTNNSEFLFMSGNYYLNASLSLENLTNVTWKSEKIKGAKIVLQGKGTLLFKNVKAFSLSGFYVYIHRDTQYSSVLFTLCTTIISNTTFDDYSEILPGGFAAVNSTVEFKGTMYFRDPLVVSYSAIFFQGHSVFENIYSPTIRLVNTSSLQVTGLLNFTGALVIQHVYIDDSSVLKLVAPVTLKFNSVTEMAIHVQDNDSTFHSICQNLDILVMCPASLKLSMATPQVKRFTWSSRETTVMGQHSLEGC